MSRIVSVALIFLVQVYRKTISPLLPPTCRFVPSCSTYALGCLRTHPPARALWLIVRRVLRCHPLSPGGFDPVPDPELKGRQ